MLRRVVQRRCFASETGGTPNTIKAPPAGGRSFTDFITLYPDISASAVRKAIAVLKAEQVRVIMKSRDLRKSKK